MTYEAAILYAKQRMREIGKLPHQYHFEPVRIVATEDQQRIGEIYIKAFNEIYIMVYPNKYFGVMILSDNSTYNSEDHTQSGAPEFTGQIVIIKITDYWNLGRMPDPNGLIPRPIPIEFLRVVIY